MKRRLRPGDRVRLRGKQLCGVVIDVQSRGKLSPLCLVKWNQPAVKFKDEYTSRTWEIESGLELSQR